jgi:hypothetical protein
MSSNSMPAIDLNSIDLSSEEQAIAELILNRGKLRASKPEVERESYTQAVTLADGRIYNRQLSRPIGNSGKAAYVWRMVAFLVSPIAKHHCMPCTADFDLPEDDYSKRREMAKELDKLVDKITNSVPRQQWYGVRRWAHAMGQA